MSQLNNILYAVKSCIFFLGSIIFNIKFFPAIGGSHIKHETSTGKFEMNENVCKVGNQNVTKQNKFDGWIVGEESYSASTLHEFTKKAEIFLRKTMKGLIT